MAAAPHPPGDAPSPWIRRFAPLVRNGAAVLDLACGRGRHSMFFAVRGCRVTAVDRDPQALAALASTSGVAPLEADVEQGPWPLAGRRFDAVVVTNYLHRPLWPAIVAAVAADGVLLYETFARGNAQYGRPSHPDFLLAPGELLSVVGERLVVVAFEQGIVTTDRAAVMQRIAAVGPARAWPPALPE
jgi:SAM-dependent methyltransferase